MSQPRGYGWRTYDVAVCKGGMSDETWQAFLQGYQQIRVLTTEEMEAVPAFLKVRPIWDEGDMLAMYPVWGEALPDENYCDRIVELLQRLTA